MSTWSSMSADAQLGVMQALGAVYAKHAALVGNQMPTAGGDNVYNLSAGSFEGSNTLSAKIKLGAAHKGAAEGLKAELMAAVGGVSDAQVEVSVGYGVGDMAGPIENVNKLDGSSCTFSHEQGQVILLDFWATWCPPCQRPMAHNQEMLVKNTGTWGDKVRIVGLSIDNEVSKLKSHVEAKGWGNVEHYHVRNGRCTADKEYGV